MKKIILGTLLAGSVLFASENSWFIGGSVGQFNATLEATIANKSFKEDDRASAFTLKVGKYVTKNDIIAFSSTGVNSDEDITMGVGELSYKHLFDFNKIILLANNKINFFAGATYGYLIYKGDDEDGKTIELNSNIMYVDLGVLSQVSDSIDVELGYKYGAFASGDDTVKINGIDVNMEFSDISRWYLGLNYKF